MLAAPQGSASGLRPTLCLGQGRHWVKKGGGTGELNGSGKFQNIILKKILPLRGTKLRLISTENFSHFKSIFSEF